MVLPWISSERLLQDKMGVLNVWVVVVLLGTLGCWTAEGHGSSRRGDTDAAAKSHTSHQESHSMEKEKADGSIHQSHSDAEEDPCHRTNCGRGRQCVLMAESGRAECVCQEKCRPSFVPVCGSDGRFYENHCEVYRTACLERRRIYVVHSKDCFFRGSACTMSEYNKLKSTLLDMQPKAAGSGERSQQRDMEEKRALVDAMFKHLDGNEDGRLISDELEKISLKQQMERSLLQCTVQDLLRYDDYNNDGHLSLHEFYTAFRLWGRRLAVHHQGDNNTHGELQLPCLWLRRPLSDSCAAVPPVILVYPETQAQEPGVSASLHCHADGIPDPKLLWLKNGMDLQLSASNQLSLIANGSELFIASVRYEDTGAFTCIAKNEAGVDEDISSLFVEDSAKKTLANILWREEGLSVGNMFYVFSDEGITVLQPSECEIRRHLKRTERIVATYEEMCPKGQGVTPQRCVWSSAVNVREKYIYVTQPLQSRLLVVDIQAQKVVQAVTTDPFPVKMLYDKSHDQVWILTWGDMDKTHPTLQVIPQASVGEVHHAIRTTFQRVTNFFIPPTNLIITHVRFAFVFLKNEPAVHKIDLETFQRVKTISLKNYSCIPASMAYTHLSGFYFIQCQSKSLLGAPAQLLVDSVTDAVIGPNQNITGQAYVSPDGRYVVTPDLRRSKLTVQMVSFQGELTLNQELDEPISVSDMVFQPSFTESNQHMLVAASRSGSDLLFADLSSGRTEVLRSLKEPLAAQAWPWGGPNRVIVSSGLFGQYLVTPSVESLFVLDGKQRTPHCEVSDIKRANTVVWVGEV
ncbi:follistatin-related protein 4 isoform X5 [Poeciliopsis prolifica]|uniref:follistatin-related protein 4 isoform X5 n=1 Tax=Poeciliopsis prolifica TaxID=188132 RepID=UPI002413494D|nr:follistatin-related protein 4 isoform X5 [Poeciliopsis prolifica]